jgi:hypothetical protein
MPLKDLPGYYPTIKDGGLGVLPPSLAGLFGVIGCSQKGTTSVKFAVDPDDVVDEYGQGTLVEHIQDAFTAGAWQIGIRRCVANVAGTVSATVTQKLYGKPDSSERATASAGLLDGVADPYSDRKFIIRISKGGKLDEAKYRLSENNGLTWSSEKTFEVTDTGPPRKSKIDMGNGTYIEFTEYQTTPENSFVAGDEYHWETTEAKADEDALMDAIEELANWKDPNTGQGFEYIYVPYPLPAGQARTATNIAAYWGSLAQVTDDLWNQETRPTWIVTNAPYMVEDGSETIDDWITVLSDASASYRHKRISINAGYSIMVDRRGKQQVRAIGGSVAGLAAKAKLHHSIGWVRYMAITNSIVVYPYHPMGTPDPDPEDHGTAKSGTLNYYPVAPWTLTLTVDGSDFVDGGDGNLYDSQTPYDKKGTIDYETGAYVLDTAPSTSSSATYKYYTKDEMDKGNLALLNDARYVTLRQWIGYGRVPTDDWMMAPPTSDYFCIRNRRIMDEAVRMVGIANVPYTNSPGISERDMAAYKADLSRPLEAMKITDEDTDKPIMDYALTLTPDENIWSNGIVHCKVEIVPTPTKKKLEAVFQLRTKIEE